MDTLDCDLDQVSVEVVDEHLSDRGYLIIRNNTLEAVAAAARNNYLGVFEREAPHSPAKTFTYEQLSKLGHWKKSAIGSRNGLGEQYAQLLVTTYVHPDSDHLPELQTLFSMMIRLRNRLMRVSDDFGPSPRETGSGTLRESITIPEVEDS